MPRRKGSLAVVGTGIESLGQMTADARREIRRAERLFCIADALGERTIRSLNKRAESLFDLYAVGKHRLKTYAGYTERYPLQLHEEDGYIEAKRKAARNVS